MSFPIIAIVGRPNVGKSSLLNYLAGSQISIVEPTPGVTRDRVSVIITRDSWHFELVDTGGIGIVDSMALESHVEKQIDVAIESADALLFVVDSRAGEHPLDKEIAKRLRSVRKPVILLANKAETEILQQTSASEFWSLGLGEPHPVSAKDGQGLDVVLNKIFAMFPEERFTEPEDDEDAVKVAVVGTRNAGKSTLVNVLTGVDRMIVSDIPGTTRDAVDIRMKERDRDVIFIDTAGMRKKKALADSIEFYSQARSMRAIRRADVVLHVIDCMKEIGRVDKVIAGETVEQCKPYVIVINKWDIARERQVDPGKYTDYIQKTLTQMWYAPVHFISAKDKMNTKSLWKTIFDLYDQSCFRCPTGELNRVLELAAEKRLPRSKGRSAKMYYGTQVSVKPPTFAIFVNSAVLFDDNYTRYLSAELRSAFPYSEIPLRIHFRDKERDKN
ncbi:MAG: ribosome biogenesis GTPase Der [Planctomycetes bacterium]|nr:ribosome biogenesis GTPase Der [Planctomycetota bacterium]